MKWSEDALEKDFIKEIWDVMSERGRGGGDTLQEKAAKKTSYQYLKSVTECWKQCQIFSCSRQI